MTTEETSDAVMSDDAKLDQIMSTITEVRISLATLVGAVGHSTARHDNADIRAGDVETRLRALERARWVIVGAGAAAGAVAGRFAGLL